MVFESHSVGYFALFFSSKNREHATQICDRETFFFRSRRQQSKFIYFLFISEGVKNRFFYGSLNATNMHKMYDNNSTRMNLPDSRVKYTMTCTVPILTVARAIFGSRVMVCTRRHYFSLS